MVAGDDRNVDWRVEKRNQVSVATLRLTSVAVDSTNFLFSELLLVEKKITKWLGELLLINKMWVPVAERVDYSGHKDV